MRGRSLRLDPALPRKVAHNWDVICIAPDHPKGLADYSRFVRKHHAYYSITADGEIESGVCHVDSALSPFAPPAPSSYAALNSSMLERTGEREQTNKRWGIGQPYQNAATETVRVHFGHPPGLPAQRLLRPAGDMPPPRAGPGLLVGAGLGGMLLVVGAATGYDLPGLAGGLGVAGAGIYRAGMALRGHLQRLGPSDSLTDMGAAVADAMRDTGLVRPELGAAAVRVSPQADGYYRCDLDGASLAESQAFAEALDDLLAPLDRPRYIIPRYISDMPRSAWSALWLAVRMIGGRKGRRVVYHVVPTAMATNRDRATAFGRTWNRHVSAGHPLFEQEPEAQALIEVQRGEDPFAITTQMRTLWR
jgi:hypothetical protein